MGNKAEQGDFEEPYAYRESEVKYFEEEAKKEERKEIYNFILKQKRLAQVNLDKEINTEFNEGMKSAYEFLLKILENK